MKTTLLMMTMFVAMHLSIGQSKNVSSYSGIQISGNLTVKLVKGSEPKVDYTIVKGHEKDLIIEVKDDILIVKIRGNNGGFTSPTKVKATIYYQQLSNLNLSAGSSVSTEGAITTPKLDLNCSSGSSVNLKLDADNLEIAASSGTSVSLSGSADVLDIEASSGSSVSASSLIAKDVDAQSTSGSSLTVYASESLKARANSGGSISYKGNPKNKKIDSGSMSGGSVSGH